MELQVFNGLMHKLYTITYKPFTTKRVNMQFQIPKYPHDLMKKTAIELYKP
jgi:hypothetical protein